MTMTRRTLLGAAALIASTCALAQGYPSKSIRVVVPFPPGGGTDIIARDITQKVAGNTGWNFVIEN